MKKAIVSYPIGISTIEVERYLMSTIEDMQEYFRLHPNYETRVIKENFRRDLREGKVLIVNNAGGYCHETESIKIVKYL